MSRDIKLNILNNITKRLNIPCYRIHECMICKAILYSKYNTCNKCHKEQEYSKCHAAGVLITTYINNKKYLLLGRASQIKSSERKGFYEFFGGVAECDETPEETAVRETLEETLGVIKLDKDNLIKHSTYKNKLGMGYILFEYNMSYDDMLQYINNFNSILQTVDNTERLEVDQLRIIEFNENKLMSQFAKKVISPTIT